MRRNFRIWLLPIALFLIWVWTWTETVAVSLSVADGRCTAELYGRTSTLECPGLAGGELGAFVSVPQASGSPLTRLRPVPAWSGLVLTDTGGAPHPPAPLPARFEASGRLRYPVRAAGLILRRAGSDTGWAFVIDADSRQGTWWTWAGAPVAPLRGIPLDQPLGQQARALVRDLLPGWFGATLLAFLVSGLARLPWPLMTTRKLPELSVVERRALVVLLAFAAFAASLRVAVNILEGVPHVQDSVTYLFQAQTMARGRLAAPSPPLAAAETTAHFAQEFMLVRDGRWFGKYPPGFPALLAAGVRAAAPWLVNPLLAALTVPLLYSLARSCLRAAGGRGSELSLVAALLLAVSPFFLVMSGSLMAHAAELFWAVLFMTAWARTLPPERFAGRTTPAAGFSLASPAVAGAALGMLFLTRQFSAAIIGVSFGLGWLIVAGAQRPGAARRALLVAALAAAPFIVALPAYQSAVTGDSFTDPRLLFWPYDRVGFGPDVGESQNVFTMTTGDPPATIWQTDPAQPPRGHSVSRGLYNLGRNLRALEDVLFGWPSLFTLALLWLPFLMRRATAVDWLLLAVAAAVAGGYIAFWSAGIAYGPRYFYTALPALVILSARGVSVLAEGRGRPVAALLVLALLAGNMAQLPGYQESYRGYNFVSAESRQAVEAAVESPALIFVTASETDWWEYGAYFSGNSPWLDGPIVYARDLGPAANAQLRAFFTDRRAYLWRDGRATALP